MRDLIIITSVTSIFGLGRVYHICFTGLLYLREISLFSTRPLPSQYNNRSSVTEIYTSYHRQKRMSHWHREGGRMHSGSGEPDPQIEDVQSIPSTSVEVRHPKGKQVLERAGPGMSRHSSQHSNRPSSQ